MDMFLASKQIKSSTSDADIIYIRLEGYNDTEFVNLIIEYAKWLKESEHDMSINPFADGSKYHRG